MRIWIFQKSEILGPINDIKLMRSDRCFLVYQKRVMILLLLLVTLMTTANTSELIPQCDDWTDGNRRSYLFPEYPITEIGR